MNFLAHLHLSDGTPPSMVGGLVAGFVRQPEVERLPAAVQEGIRLHRVIDAFTDRHPIVHGSIARLGGKFGWFSGILIDVYYDHILARDWSRYSNEPLRAFADRFQIADGDDPPAAAGAKEVRLTYRLRPRSADVDQVPELRFAYYNPASRLVQTTFAKKLPIRVLPAAPPPADLPKLARQTS